MWVKLASQCVDLFACNLTHPKMLFFEARRWAILNTSCCTAIGLVLPDGYIILSIFGHLEQYKFV